MTPSQPSTQADSQASASTADYDTPRVKKQIQKSTVKPGKDHTEDAPKKPLTMGAKPKGPIGPQDRAPKHELETQEVQE